MTSSFTCLLDPTMGTSTVSRHQDSTRSRDIKTPDGRNRVRMDLTARHMIRPRSSHTSLETWPGLEGRYGGYMGTYRSRQDRYGRPLQTRNRPPCPLQGAQLPGRENKGTPTILLRKPIVTREPPGGCRGAKASPHLCPLVATEMPSPSPRPKRAISHHPEKDKRLSRLQVLVWSFSLRTQVPSRPVFPSSILPWCLHRDPISRLLDGQETHPLQSYCSSLPCGHLPRSLPPPKWRRVYF